MSMGPLLRSDIVDGAAPHDEYIDEMLALSLSQIEESSSWALHIRSFRGASDFVDPPLSFDVLSGFVSRSDIVSDVSSMDLSIFEYLPVSCDIDLSAPSSPTSQIFDIDDEIAQHDSDDDSSSVSDSDPVDQRVSPAVGDTRLLILALDQPRELRIGSDLSTDERDSLIQLLRAYLDVFAWSYEDMPALIHLSSSIVCHFCPARPVKQKLRRLHPRWSLQDGKVRVCVDFRDLNKASPKDDFPLPHIDMLVDSTAGHSMLSFMDGFSGVMPFGLKNAGATYQRAATTLFHDMMHRDVEFRLRLNPKKCTFGVTSGKLLGYMVSERGIEVDPDKIRAILTCLHRGQRGVSARIREDQRVLVVASSVWRLLHQAVLYSYTCCLRRGFGCMLAQLDDSGKDRAIYYLSKRMLDYETRYVMIERYCLALTRSVGRLMRWLVLLTEFDIHYVTQKSIRGSIVADHLASLPVSDARAIDDDFPDEDVAAVTSLSVGACTLMVQPTILDTG
ncbi:hypothetical protein CK203_068113 [Vitis vinifera]|uniref:Reverse transcriptase RNase H-like domain-containing protein n=1 Tax=Vitis vinifera TaxID=29760 RepID=A0A438E1P4_VITVI|nr:hypothetical protein CK203_068113 [Vitis vinifera]